MYVLIFSTTFVWNISQFTNEWARNSTIYLIGDRGSTVVAGSIPDGVIGIFHWHNPSDRTMALGSTQHLTEYQEHFLGVKAAGA